MLDELELFTPPLSGFAGSCEMNATLPDGHNCSITMLIGIHAYQAGSITAEQGF